VKAKLKMNEIFQQKIFTLNCKGKLLTLEKPVVMGVVNFTPDSFFEGSRMTDEKIYLSRVEQMLKDGATIIDIGGQSTRPNAELISAEEELKRVIIPLQNLKKEFPDSIFSIDTFYAKVAQEAVFNGASMLNDISNGSIDSRMLATVADLQVPYVLMHSKGTPQNMQQMSDYENVSNEVFEFFKQKIDELKQLKIQDVIIDVGFGFAKTIEQNFELMKNISDFKVFEKPMMVGVSRKSMIWKTLKTTPEKSLNGTTALNMFALKQGAKILRVHDVKEAIETIELFYHLQ
jgi:dihydropteroate synthase